MLILIKALVLNQQSLTAGAPSSTSQFSHHLSLLSAKSDTQRRESLSHLTSSVVSRPVNTPLPQPVSVMLPSLLPLILDGNSGVRTQLLKLFRSFPSGEVEDHVSQLMPYIRAGMTHLAADIRVSSVEILSWLLSAAGNEVVSCAGGWIKTMNCFLSLLGWHSDESTKWSSNRASFGKAGSEGKPMIKALVAFSEFLRAGIGPEEEDDADSEEEGHTTLVTTATWGFPLCQTSQHMLPTKSSPFAHLSLFGSPRNEDGEMYETREARYRVFAEKFQGPVARGVDAARKEGGELGRASTITAKVLKEAIISGPGS